MVDNETAYSKDSCDFCFRAHQSFVYEFPITNNDLFGMNIFIFGNEYGLIVSEDAPGCLRKGEVRDAFKHAFYNVGMILG